MINKHYLDRFDSLKERIAKSHFDAVKEFFNRNFDFENEIVRGDFRRYFTKPLIWGVSLLDASSFDLSDVDERVLRRVPFSSLTVWPEEDKLPKGFEPKKIIEEALHFKGLGFEKVNQRGFSGQGIKVAYIDLPFDTSHQEFEGRKIEYKEFSNNIHFHGYATASRLVGKNIGVARDVDLVFYGTNPDYACEYGDEDVSSIKEQLDAIEDVVKKLKSGEKICAIGISASIESQLEDIESEEVRLMFVQRYNDLADTLRNFDCELIDTDRFMKDFGFAYMKDTLGDRNDLDNYDTIYPQNKEKVNVIEAGKCYPMPFTIDEYKYENSVGCASYSVPQVVGMYAIAKQIDSKLDFKRFVEFAKKTATKNNSGMTFLNAEALICCLIRQAEELKTMDF